MSVELIEPMLTRLKLTAIRDQLDNLLPLPEPLLEGTILCGSPFNRQECDCPVDKTGVETGQSEPPGQKPGNRTLACPCGAIDCDDHASKP